MLSSSRNLLPKIRLLPFSRRSSFLLFRLFDNSGVDFWQVVGLTPAHQMLANPIQRFRIPANTHNVQLHVGRRRLVLTVGKSVRKWGAWVGRNVAGGIVKIVGHDCAKANCGPAQSVVCGLASSESGKSSPTTLMAWLKFPHHTHNMNKLVLKKTYVLAATPRFANKCLSRDATLGRPSEYDGKWHESKNGYPTAYDNVK
jgi:hypothetical protein